MSEITRYKLHCGWLYECASYFKPAAIQDDVPMVLASDHDKRVAELEAEVERLKEEKDSAIRILARQIDKFHAALIERDALHVEVERLIEDRARFPDKPDDIGRMIHSHMENLKAGQSSAETYAKALRAELDSLKDSIRLAALQAIEVFEGNQDAKQAVEYMRELLLADARTAKPEVDHE